MEDIKGKINLLIQRGLFHIFGTSIVNNIIQFLTNIFIVHLVSKNEYGVYTYANNIMSFFLLVRGLGLVSGLLQFASEESSVEERIKIYKYTLVKGNQINILLSIGLLLWSIFGYVKLDSSRIYLGAMAIVPILQWMFDYVTSIFRIKQNNIWSVSYTHLDVYKRQVDAHAGKDALELVLAIYKSQKEGRAVKIPMEHFASTDMQGEF